MVYTHTQKVQLHIFKLINEVGACWENLHIFIW